MKTFYIHISVINLAHYILGAAYRPSSLIKNRTPDIQDTLNNHLVLSDEKWGKENDCSIEIVLTNEEEISLKKASNIYYAFPGFLPLSRTRRVYCIDKSIADSTIWNIQKGAGFVNDILVEIDLNPTRSLEIGEEVLNVEFSDEDYTLVSKGYSAFNKILGGLAMLRTVGEGLKDYYSIDELALYSYFNEKIKDELISTGIKLDSELISYFDGSRSSFLKHLTHEITDEYVHRYLTERNITFSKGFGGIKFESIESNEEGLLLAILSVFRENGNKGVEDLIFSEFQKYPKEKQLEIALVYGIHRGYERLRNEFKNINSNKTVKYSISNPLEFYIIESVYNYGKNKSISSEFTYIDSFDAIRGNEINPRTGYKILNLLGGSILTDVLKRESSLADKLIDLFTNKIKGFFVKSIIKVDEVELRNQLQSGVQEILESAVNKEDKTVAKEDPVKFENDKEPLPLQKGSLVSAVQDSSLQELKLEDTVNEVNTEKVLKRKKKDELKAIAIDKKLDFPNKITNAQLIELILKSV